MTDRNSPETEPGDASTWPRNGRSLGLLIASLVAVVMIVGGLLAASQAGAAGRWFSHRHGWNHGESHDPERLREHAAHAADWIGRYVDTSDEQRARLEVILADGVSELVVLAEDHRSRRAEFVDLLSQPVVDRAALEDLRARELELVERASRQLVASLADAAEVLTPEQRAELIEFADHAHH